MKNKYVSPILEAFVLKDVGEMSLFFSKESDNEEIKTVDFDSWSIK